MTMDSNPLDMYMLLCVYLECLYQWALDLANASPFASFLNFVDWYLKKVEAFDIETWLYVCSPNVIV